jgi:DNA-binding MarR family transcriptional regulator
MEEPRWLDDEQQRAWRKFVGVVIKLPAALDSQLQRDAGITHFGFVVLALLSEAPDRTLRLSQLASESNASLSRMSHVIDRLEQQGWVQRQRRGRGNVAIMTDAGWDKLVSAVPGHVEAVQSLVFDGLDRTQVRELDRISTALLGLLDPPP